MTWECDGQETDGQRAVGQQQREAQEVPCSWVDITGALGTHYCLSPMFNTEPRFCPPVSELMLPGGRSAGSPMNRSVLMGFVLQCGIPFSSSLSSPSHLWVQPWLLGLLRAQLLASCFCWPITSTLLPSYGHPGTSL